MGRRDEQRVEVRDRILEAASTLFVEHGVDEVTVAEVAEHAGVSRATVFNHFNSKHALVEGITERVLAFYVLMLDEALVDEVTPVPVLLRRLFEDMGKSIENERRFFRSVFREIARLQLGVDEGGPGQRATEAAHERLVQLVRRGQDRGELSSEHEAEAITSAFTALSNGTITHWLYDDATGSLLDRMRAAIDLLLAPVETTRAKAAKRKGRRS
jgi:AcrR family transcriptional regulator